MKYRIWVDSHVLKAPYKQPPLIVEKQGSDPVKTRRVDILGPSSIVFDPTANKAPHVWVETECDIRMWSHPKGTSIVSSESRRQS